jgi:CDP-paratose 2-epimerase
MNLPVNSSSSSRVVLIFGGAGFIGSNWAHFLLTNTEASVHVFDNLSRKNGEDNLRWLRKSPGADRRLQVTVADIRDRRGVERAVYAASEIYHFAAQTGVTASLEDPRTDFEVNALGTFNIVEAARRSGNGPFLLFTSTGKVYRQIRPSHSDHGVLDRNFQAGNNSVVESQTLDFHFPHGCSKGMADQYVHDYARTFGVPTVVFRVSSVAGPGQCGNHDQSWVSRFIFSALARKPIFIYGNGRQVRDVLAIEDLLRAFAAAYEYREKTAGQIYNIGGGADNVVSLVEFIALIETVLNVRVEYRLRPARLGDQSVYITNFAKFTKHTEWLPERSVEQIVYDIGHWCRSREMLSLPAQLPIPASAIASDALRHTVKFAPGRAG